MRCNTEVLGEMIPVRSITGHQCVVMFLEKMPIIFCEKILGGHGHPIHC